MAGQTFAADTTASTAEEAISFFNDAGSLRYLENRNLTALSRQVCAKRTRFPNVLTLSMSLSSLESNLNRKDL